MTNELREKIEKDLYEGMYMTVNVYWKTIYDTVEKYIDETDDDSDTFGIYTNQIYCSNRNGADRCNALRRYFVTKSVYTRWNSRCKNSIK